MQLHLICAGLLMAGAVFANDFPEIATFTGMCDASAATAIDSERFIVADDEDNILRVYSRRGGMPLVERDVSEFIEAMGKKKPKEADLEAAARIGSTIFWITSHGRDSKGKEKPERQRLFATDVKVTGNTVQIEPKGKPYTGLLDVLLSDQRLAKYNLVQASELPPKSEGALNIEGLAATTDGHLLIGFRNPVYEGKALIVPLLNPLEVIEGTEAKLGDPIEIDLQGLGIRSIGFYAGRFLIIAGSTGIGGQSRAFEWDGKGKPKLIEKINFEGLNPEGIAFHNQDGSAEFFVLSDDGAVDVDGTDCKKLKDPMLKSFRGRKVYP